MKYSLQYWAFRCSIHFDVFVAVVAVDDVIFVDSVARILSVTFGIAINTYTHTINSNVFAVSIYCIQSHINGFNIEWRKGFTQRKIQLSKEKGIRIELSYTWENEKKLCHEIREEENHTRRNGLSSKENTRIAGKMPILLKLWTLAALFLSRSLWLSITWNQRRHNKITFFEIG